MAFENILAFLLVAILTVVMVDILFKYFKQPHIVSYIIVGIILGPFGLNFISDTPTLSFIGEIGIILLLFFIAMKINLHKIVSNWKISTIGTLLQIVITTSLVFILTIFLDWSLERIILLGFVMSLSSTAVILKLLEYWVETDTRIGENIIGILIVQDILIVPMLIIINFLGGNTPTPTEIGIQIFGGFLILYILMKIIEKGKVNIPFDDVLSADKELQVFTSLLLCFGFAFITHIMGLSAALGGFVSGLVISASRNRKWVQNSLHSIRTLFVAGFFLYIGIIIDVNFVISNLFTIFLLLIALFVSNTFINAFIIKMLGNNWNDSLYSGSLLSQIGEFSFVLASTGFAAGIIGNFEYQMTIAIISISLLVSPIWITVIKNILRNKIKTKNLIKYDPY